MQLTPGKPGWTPAPRYHFVNSIVAVGIQASTGRPVRIGRGRIDQAHQGGRIRVPGDVWQAANDPHWGDDILHIANAVVVRDATASMQSPLAPR